MFKNYFLRKEYTPPKKKKIKWLLFIRFLICVPIKWTRNLEYGTNGPGTPDIEWIKSRNPGYKMYKVQEPRIKNVKGPGTPDIEYKNSSPDLESVRSSNPGLCIRSRNPGYRMNRIQEPPNTDWIKSRNPGCRIQKVQEPWI